MNTNNTTDLLNHEPSTNIPHSTVKGYITGFLLSLILTAIPFCLVMYRLIDNSGTLGFVILGIAVIQIIIHMIYFLHMNNKTEGGWSLLSLLFTIMLLVIMMSGSIWVMYHLNVNMMPGMMNETI